MSCVTKLKELFRKIDYEFYLFAFLMLDLVARCPLEVNPWMTPNYILNFDQGFSTDVYKRQGQYRVRTVLLYHYQHSRTA